MGVCLNSNAWKLCQFLFETSDDFPVDWSGKEEMDDLHLYFHLSNHPRTFFHWASAMSLSLNSKLRKVSALSNDDNSRGNFMVTIIMIMIMIKTTTLMMMMTVVEVAVMMMMLIKSVLMLTTPRFIEEPLQS